MSLLRRTGVDEREQAEGSRALKELPAPDEPMRSAPVAHSSINAQIRAAEKCPPDRIQPVGAGFARLPGHRASRAVAPSVTLA